MAKKRILIVDALGDIASPIEQFSQAKKYDFASVKTGDECLKKIETFKPDLIVSELFLSDSNAIEILKQIKQTSFGKEIGMIILSNYPMIQNHHAAVTAGVKYFLLKPFKVSFIFQLFNRYFLGTLNPDPFSFPSYFKKPQEKQPEPPTSNTYIKFWGTRGSTSIAGTEYVRFGGNSSCLEIKDDKTLVIIDAGTGIRELGKLIPKTHKKIDLLLGHTHLDHVVGFPFFDPLYDPECHIVIWSPIGFEKTGKEFFKELLDYSLFPVRIEDIQAKLTFKELLPGTPLQFGKIKISTHYTCHPGPTLGFKIQVGKTTFGYITDNEVFMGYLGHPGKIHKNHESLMQYKSLFDFLEGCDFLVHEAQYTPMEYLAKMGWGHSSMSNATILVKHLGVKKWYVTHHDPSHTDEDLIKKHLFHKKLLEECKCDCSVSMAFDSLTIPLP